MDVQQTERSIQEIWKMFAETDQRFKATDRKIEETARQIKDTDRQIADTDRQMKETARQIKDTDRQMKETARQIADTDRQMKETDRQMKATDRRIGELSGKWGRFVEGMVAPGVSRLFAERGIQVEKVYQRVRVAGMEIDVLAIDGGYAVLIEVKSTLGVDDVREHIERLGRFKIYFPEYADRQVVGAVAGIVIEEGVDRFAYKRGLYVIAQSGETVRILNDPDFKPRLY